MSSHPLIPRDVLEHHIVPNLPISTFIVLAFVSRSCHLMATNRLKTKIVSLEMVDIYKDIFSNGSISYLQWYHNVLRYPHIFTETSQSFLSECFGLAAKGKFNIKEENYWSGEKRSSVEKSNTETNYHVMLLLLMNIFITLFFKKNSWSPIDSSVCC